MEVFLEDRCSWYLNGHYIQRAKNEETILVCLKKTQDAIEAELFVCGK